MRDIEAHKNELKFKTRLYDEIFGCIPENDLGAELELREKRNNST